ncbi:HU family DNA-binding protein [Bacteroides acidifaciens]|uniref:HU family DNA-binding protein n=1 Tax=Bacteroides acidifaciens TaxID=85831 RepID=UPI002149FDCA|nr:HU family DNA-binding protein [Bacteroides acidifaciens]MCR2005294.1 HU family DNA-binding protein [Bacteroides acidifaciens]
MPVLYGSFQSVLKDKNGKQLFYPRVLRTGNVSTSQLSKEIAAYSSLSPGDVKNTLDNLVTVVSQHLQSSESVTLDGFGTFRLVMKSNGKGVESADEVSASQASLTVRFLPCSTRHLDGTMATRSLVTGARCVRFDRADASASDGGNSGNPNGGGADGGETPDPDPAA